MFAQFQPSVRDFQMRLVGLLLLPFGALAIQTLFRLVHTGRPHEATAIEVALATAGFLCLSLGSALFGLGRHLLARVEVSARWAPPRRFAPNGFVERREREISSKEFNRDAWVARSP